jgi:hypothetical protein
VVDPELVELVKKVKELDLDVVKQLPKPHQFQVTRVREDFDVEDIE